MREKDGWEAGASSADAKFMNSSQVKQTINKLDKADGDARRTALNSLKQCVEAMDPAAMPRFIAQVSEAKETSRAYAISLYEDVARVHGKLMIPHIPRVMTTITKTLSSSGSSPQLQQACAKVISAIAQHAIDEGSPAQASNVLRDICNPLLDVLTVRLEPLAAGAATCLQTLVENEKWKYASSAVVEDLCLKTTVALAEKGTRTVAHMQLARSLAASNSSFLGSYGVTLLRSGVEVLRSSAASAPWQQRASAARLLTAVLPTVDRATLAEELSITVQALENCKHDRMSNVRWAVKEALKTARGVLSEENTRRSSDGDELLSWMNPSPEASSSSPRRRSSLGGVSSDEMMSPPTIRRSLKSSHRSPVSSVIPLSPSAPSRSPRSHAAATTALALDELPLRSPLQATRKLYSQVGSFDTSVTHFLDLDSPRKENLPSHDPDTKMGTLAFDSDLSPSKPSTNEGALAPYPSSTGMSPAVSAKGHEENCPVSPDPLSALMGRDDLGGGILAGEEDMFLLPNGDTPPRADSGHESSEQLLMRSSRDGGLNDSPTNGAASRSYHGVLNGSTMKHVFELKRGPALRSSPRAKDDEIVTPVVSPSKSDNSYGKVASNGYLGSPLRTDSSLNLDSLQEPFSPENTKPLLLAEDFLAFTTPRRLVRSLQEFSVQGSSPARYPEEDSARVSREEDDFGDKMGADMDLGTPTSTSTGWSVRTNPIASDESLRTESDDSDHEQQRRSWKKMTLLEPSTSPTPPAPHTPPAQETDNPDINDGFRHRLDHPSSAAAASLMQPEEFSQPEGFSLPENLSRCPSGENSVELKPELSNGVDIKRMALGKEGEHATSECGSTTLENGVDKWSCSDAQSQRSEHEHEVAYAPEITAHGDEGSDSSATTDSVVALSVGKDGSEVLHVEFNLRKPISRRGWRERLSHTVFSWQVCVVIVAIPFAFVLAKVVFPSDPRFTGYLVPT